jgi:hypothetical protein
MLKFHRVLILAALGMILPVLSLNARAETVRFAWPDGASATVRARSEGRRVPKGGETRAWDMSCEFTMRVRRTGDRVVVSREGFSGWKGTLPPSFGGGAERFTDMIPTFIVSGDGKFLGIEGHDTARKLMNSSVEQSGGLDAPSRNVFETLLSNAALEAMARDHWATLVVIWQDVELDPEASYELRSVTAVPQLGGGHININGMVKFVKETDCASGRAGQRCAHFQSETGADTEQLSKVIQTLIQEAGAGRPTITAWDQRFNVDIVVEKATGLPQQLTLTRFHALNVRMQGREEGGSEEIKKTYTFNWLVPHEEGKR